LDGLHACPSKFPSAPFNASACLRMTIACMEVLHVCHRGTTKHKYNFGRCLHACPSNFPSAPFNASTCLRITMTCMEVLHVGHGCTTKHMYNFGRCCTTCGSWRYYKAHVQFWSVLACMPIQISICSI
jgi:hypothetical protein